MLSDLYPPAGLGGYEVAASEVVGALRERGHNVRVLTTDYRLANAPGTEPGVLRVLKSRLRTRSSPLALPLLAAAEARDDRATARLLADARPDVVFLWNIGGVSHRVLARLMNGPTPAVSYVFGDWPLRKFRAPHDLDRWTSFFVPRAEAGPRRAARAGLERAPRLSGLRTHAEPLRFDHFQFGSRFMMDMFHRGGLRAARSERVVYYGLFGEFARAAAEPTRPPAATDGPTRILFAGRLWEAKGLHTLIEALAILATRGAEGFALTVAGPVEHADYAQRLKRLAAGGGVAERVDWVGPVPRDRLLAAYRGHHVVVFPSIYDEPFGIVQLEAMAVGCTVVGTGTGGSAEILEPEVNALLFPAGDAALLADQLARLAADPALGARLAAGGKDTVRRRFLGSRMVDEIDAHLAKIATGGTR